MLYWICPECGGECSPAVRECPACAGVSATSPASAGPVRRKSGVGDEVLALAQNLAPTASYTPVPAPVILPQSPAAANGSAGGNGHAVETVTLDFPEAPSEEELREPASDAIESLVRPLIESTTRAMPEPQPEPVAPEALCRAMALQAELALDRIAQQSIAEQSAIRGIVAAFQQQPKTSLLPPATEDIKPPAPVCVQWMPVPRPRILPVPPKDLDHRAVLSGIQSPPLAGPCVPPALRSLTEWRSATRTKGRKKASLPAWTVSFVVALTLFLAIGTVLQHLGANRDAKNATPPPASNDTASTSAIAAEQPASKLVEVTGLRVAMGPNQRPQLEFIVVNHSGTALSGVGLRIAVRSASSQSGVAPLFRVSATIPSLGAYQSREFRAELDPEVHATDVPDWRSLRADVRIIQ